MDRKSKILLAIGGLFAFFVALPLFLYAVLSPNGTFELRKSAQVVGNLYYIDSISGNDTNNGTSEATPWKTLNAVNSYAFQPGDKILFKKGSAYSGVLTLNSSGTSSSPITISSYGVTGNAPSFTNPGGNDIILVNGSWNIVENLYISGGAEKGIRLNLGDNNIVRNNEISDVGHGVGVMSQYNTITNNYIHDLIMIVNTNNGGNDDAGAVGVVLFNSNNEVSYNRFIDCNAQSYDFGTDGGAVELFAYNAPVDNSYIHHNYAENNDGFFELGGTGYSMSGSRISYNLLKNNNGKVGTFNLSGTFATSVSSFSVDNNTAIEENGGWLLFWFSSAPTTSTFSMKNNIFVTSNFSSGIANTTTFTHTNNLYKLTNTALGFTKDATELLADPSFVSSTDYHLQPTSPAIDSGVNLGYSTDYDNNTVPSGSLPDIGAYEYQSVQTPTPTSSPSPSPNPTNSPSQTPTILPSPTASAVASATPSPSLIPTTCNVADINKDGIVDITDYSILVTDFFETNPSNPRSDINNDGIVDITDYSTMVTNFFVNTGACQ